MALSSTIYNIESGDVGKYVFDLTFEGATAHPPGYLAEEHIFMWLNDIQVTVGGGATQYDGSGITFVFTTDTSVTVTGHLAELDDKIEFRRTIPKDTLQIDFVDGAGITESDLDTQSLANLYSVHEIMDGFGTGTQNYYELAKLYANGPEDYEVEPGNYSALHFSIKASDSATAAETAETNAETAETAAEAAQAAAEAAQTAAETAETNAETAETNAETAETNAAASAAAALVSEGNASDSEDAAAASETAAGLSETAAEAAQTAAETAETNAETAETAAETAQTNAETAETNAESHADDAETAMLMAEAWAEEDEDTEVTTGQFSAKHWAAKSAISAGANPNLLVNGGLHQTVYGEGSTSVARNNFADFTFGYETSGGMWNAYNSLRTLTAAEKAAIDGSPPRCCTMRRQQVNTSAGAVSMTNVSLFGTDLFDRMSNTSVVLSVWVKGASGGERVAIGLCGSDTSTPRWYALHPYLDMADITVTSSWQKFTRTISIPDLSALMSAAAGTFLGCAVVCEQDAGTGPYDDTIEWTAMKLEYGTAATPWAFWEGGTKNSEEYECARWTQKSCKDTHWGRSAGSAYTWPSADLGGAIVCVAEGTAYASQSVQFRVPLATDSFYSTSDLRVVNPSTGLFQFYNSSLGSGVTANVYRQGKHGFTMSMSPAQTHGHTITYHWQVSCLPWANRMSY